jgi:hypothetical protein
MLYREPYSMLGDKCKVLDPASKAVDTQCEPNKDKNVRDLKEVSSRVSLPPIRQRAVY